MTQDEKQLLLQDICAKLPYGVKLNIGEYSDFKHIGIIITDEFPIKVEVIENDIPYRVEVSLDMVKPYLRPMSSMTEEEKEYIEYTFGVTYVDEDIIDYSTSTIMSVTKSSLVLEWLNEHYFDYRKNKECKTMIEAGLALMAPEGMYNVK